MILVLELFHRLPTSAATSLLWALLDTPTRQRCSRMARFSLREVSSIPQATRQPVRRCISRSRSRRRHSFQSVSVRSILRDRFSRETLSALMPWTRITNRLLRLRGTLLTLPIGSRRSATTPAIPAQLSLLGKGLCTYMPVQDPFVATQVRSRSVRQRSLPSH